MSSCRATNANWTAIAANLAAMSAKQLDAEVLDWRRILTALECTNLKREPANRNWDGHGEVVARLRLAERALTKAKQDAR